MADARERGQRALRQFAFAVKLKQLRQPVDGARLADFAECCHRRQLDCAIAFVDGCDHDIAEPLVEKQVAGTPLIQPAHDVNRGKPERRVRQVEDRGQIRRRYLQQILASHAGGLHTQRAEGIQRFDCHLRRVVSDRRAQGRQHLRRHQRGAQRERPGVKRVLRRGPRAIFDGDETEFLDRLALAGNEDIQLGGNRFELHGVIRIADGLRQRNRGFDVRRLLQQRDRSQPDLRFRGGESADGLVEGNLRAGARGQQHERRRHRGAPNGRTHTHVTFPLQALS